MINILIVDDFPLNRMLLRTFLLDYFDKCYESQNGKEAIQQYINNNIDIIFMDIQMPVMNGIESSNMIRSLNKNSVIFAVTAYYSPNELYNYDNYHDNLFNEIIQKPFSKEILLTSIKKYFDI